MSTVLEEAILMVLVADFSKDCNIECLEIFVLLATFLTPESFKYLKHLGRGVRR